jgi:hypothetical protein
MTPTEAVLLTEYVAACCPQQRIGEYTPDAWHDLLRDLRFNDCRTAVNIVARRQPFVSPSEIRAEVRKIREDRIARSAIPAPPAELADDPAAYRQAIADSAHRAGDGRFIIDAEREQRAITAGVTPIKRERSMPAPLRAAIADLRRQLGPGRAPRRTIGDERQVARDQVAEMRAAREQAEEGESA